MKDQVLNLLQDEIFFEKNFQFSILTKFLEKTSKTNMRTNLEDKQNDKRLENSKLPFRTPYGKEVQNEIVESNFHNNKYESMGESRRILRGDFPSEPINTDSFRLLCEVASCASGRSQTGDYSFRSILNQI